MLTKSDFQKAIADSIGNYPSVAPLYQAGDPRIIQHLDAIATMFAMLSSQVEVAAMEPFEKVRDATVLADAAMRGIVPNGKPARVRLSVANKGTGPCTVDSGRIAFDSAGNPYRVESSLTLAAGASGTIEATQVRKVEISHVVADSVPFYAIQIPVADDGSYLCGVSVSDADGDYTFRNRYVNTLPEERVFHVEADDRQRVYVRFGFGGVVGVQPLNGNTIAMTVFYTAGEVNPAFGSPFAFDYIGSPAESSLEMKMDALLVAGQKPMGISVLRELARYPSVYDENAVFLGEFDFLVRKAIPTLKFLSVWNESAEELARGPSFDNINTLFVACMSADGSESSVSQPNPLVAVPPNVIVSASLTGTQKAIRTAILGADDSYKVKFYTPVRSKIVMTIRAMVSTSYVASDVRQKIIDLILAEYGETAAASRRGKSKPLYQRVYAILKKNVAALADGGADLTVNIEEPASIENRPEMWRYVAPDSLTVVVDSVNIVTPSWGG